MRVLVVTGTGTGVGKTVVTAAVAALAAAAGERVVVVKPAQTGVGPEEPGDLADVVRLAGPLETLELARFPDPLAPATAARRVGAAALAPSTVVDAVRGLDADLVLVEGAGGLLVRLDDAGGTLADVAAGLREPADADGLREPADADGPREPADADGPREPADTAGLRDPALGVQVLLVAAPGLGVLNAAALTAEALAARGLPLRGTVVGAYPDAPDLAERTNLADLPVVTSAPLLGVLPAGLGALDRATFAARARCGLGPSLGGRWSPGPAG